MFLTNHALLYVFYLSFGGLLVDKPKHNLGLLYLLISTLYTYIFNNIVSIADSSSIDKAELYAVNNGGVLDKISCCSVYIAHNSLILM